jgi:hypothetical protein
MKTGYRGSGIGYRHMKKGIGYRGSGIGKEEEFTYKNS